MDVDGVGVGVDGVGVDVDGVGKVFDGEDGALTPWAVGINDEGGCL